VEEQDGRRMIVEEAAVIAGEAVADKQCFCKSEIRISKFENPKNE
jgi:hypothetical protein